MRKITIAAAAAAALVSTAALASVTFDPSSGTGFVGKGDVQLVLGMNNAQIQAATLNFTYQSTSVTEVSWTCYKSSNETEQVRSRTTTTSSSDVVSGVARVKNQITGYNLNGFVSGSTTSTSSTDGPPLNSCPSANSGFVLQTPAGDPVTIASSGGLFVNGVPLS